MVRTPKKPKKTPKKQNRESPTNITKDQRSEFGKILYDDFLRRERRKLTQKDLAQAMGVSQSTISDLMYHIAAIGYDQDAYDHLYNFFKGFNDLHISIPQDLAWKLLDAVKDHRDNKDAYLTQHRKKELITRLKKELIIRQTYYTSDGIPVIGRDEDIPNVLNIIKDKDRRLVFLVGLPGVGKTELARQVSIEAEAQGIFTTVLTLSLSLETTLPDAVIKMLSNSLENIPKQHQTLVILHNCEQIEGSTGSLREALSDFINKHKHITILATSRKKITRKDFLVKPLDAPETKYEPLKTLQYYEAVMLFLKSVNVTRKEEKDNLFEITKDNSEKIAHLCGALGGIPLMLNMTASWVDDLGLEEVYGDLVSGDIYRLEDPHYKEDRQISIDSVIRWSYDRLQPQEQMLFRRLGIFAGGWSREAAITICNLNDGLPTDNPNFTNIILALKHHHLVSYPNGRIEIAHNTLRVFSSMELTKNKEEAERLIDRFLDYYDQLLAGWITKYDPLRGQEELKKYDALLFKPWLVRFHLLEIGKTVKDYHNLLDIEYEESKKYNELLDREEKNLAHAYALLLLYGKDFIIGEIFKKLGEEEYTFIIHEILVLVRDDFLRKIENSNIDDELRTKYVTEIIEEIMNSPYLIDAAVTYYAKIIGYIPTEFGFMQCKLTRYDILNPLFTAVWFKSLMWRNEYESNYSYFIFTNNTPPISIKQQSQEKIKTWLNKRRNS